MSVDVADFDSYSGDFRELSQTTHRYMARGLATATLLTRRPSFQQALAYLQTQAGLAELNFALQSLPSREEGTLLFIGTGITPFPYILTDMGYKVKALSSQVDDTVALNQAGQDTFGLSVTYSIAADHSISFAKDRFATVVNLSALDNVLPSDLPLAFAEMLRVCAPNGQIILTAQPKQLHSMAELLGVSLPLSSGRVGLTFSVPSTDDARQVWIDHLKALARQSPFADDDASYRRVTTPEGETYWLSRNDDIIFEGLQRGEFEADLTRFFTRFCRAGDVIFDIGANIGVHTVTLARLGAEVHAFEPGRQTFQCLTRNVLEKQIEAYLNPFGLSNENKVLYLRLAAEGRAALNSFGIPFGPGADHADHYATEASWVETLDHYVIHHELERLDLLKIDVEGWEERVIRGSISALLKYKPTLVLEFNSSTARNSNGSCLELARLVTALGYNLYRYLPEANLLELIDADRNEWLYTNLIGIHHNTVDQVLARLRGDQASGEIIEADKGEWKQLLWENRSLHQRLLANAVDQEVLTLRRLFRDSELDRAARQEVIDRLKQQLETSETDRAARLEVINNLKRQLDASEADREARLEVINNLKQQLDAGKNTLQPTYELGKPMDSIGSRAMTYIRRKFGKPLD